MNTELTLVILAAGMGSRYGGLKQLDPMGPSGESVLDYSVFDAVRAGFTKIVFVIRRDIEDVFRKSIGSRYAGSVEIRYAFQDMEDLPDRFQLPEERLKPWGTGHAVRAARHFISGPFAVINADDFYGADAYRILASVLQENPSGDGSRVFIVGYSLSNTLSPHGAVNRGLCSSDNGLLTSVKEITEIKRDTDGISGISETGKSIQLEEDALVSMNFWGFYPGFLPLLEKHFIRFLEDRGKEEKSEFYLTTLIDILLGENEVRCSLLATTASWFGITYPQDKPQVQDELRKRVEAGEYPSPLDG